MPLNHISQYSELTDAHFVAIGRIVVEWSSLEFLLRSILARLLCTADYLSRTYTDRLSASKIQDAIDEALRIQKFRYHCEIIPLKLIEEIEVFNRRITTLRTTRNKFAHFCWSRSTDEQIFGTRFAGGVPNPKKEKKDNAVLSVTELDAFYQEAYAAVDTLQEILAKLPELKEDGIIRRWPKIGSCVCRYRAAAEP